MRHDVDWVQRTCDALNHLHKNMNGDDNNGHYSRN